MKTNDELANLMSQIIDKLNRVEANVCHLKSDPQALKDAIDTAIANLNAATPKYQDVHFRTGRVIRFYDDGSSAELSRER